VSPTYRHTFTVPASAIDANGHVNNVEFVRWMQDAAVAHADAVGCTSATTAAGATWVVRSHRVEYLRPAFVGESLQVRTHVADIRRSFSTRKYEFVRREPDGSETPVARGETDWVFVDTATGRPRSIPAAVQQPFGFGVSSGAEGSAQG
jgi:acyl-CoA thioester hydrolase